MSKWVETAMRPVPERSHILNTWPTNAGPPPPLMFEFSPAILTVDGNPEVDSGDDATPFMAEVLESGWKARGFGELGRRSPTRIAGGVVDGDGVVLGEAKLERRLDAVEWTRWVTVGPSC